MINLFQPDMSAKNIYSIDYDKLYEAGIRLLIFDIDGTLLRSIRTTGFSVRTELIDLFANLKRKGFDITLLSNNKKTRLGPVLRKTNIESGFAEAKKPRPEAFETVYQHHRYQKEQMAMIGNNIFTDIYGANKFGITSILVGPLSMTANDAGAKEFIFTKPKTL